LGVSRRSGTVRLLRHGGQGEEVVLHNARLGEFFAEASLDSARYHCDADASEPSELLQVPARQLRAVRTQSDSGDDRGYGARE
jgi:CRP-like cAMP-binding protein